MQAVKDKEQILNEIRERVLQQYESSGVPIPFKMEDCGTDEFYLKDLSTGKVRKVRVIATDSGTKLVDI